MVLYVCRTDVLIALDSFEAQDATSMGRIARLATSRVSVPCFICIRRELENALSGEYRGTARAAALESTGVELTAADTPLDLFTQTEPATGNTGCGTDSISSA